MKMKCTAFVLRGASWQRSIQAISVKFVVIYYSWYVVHLLSISTSLCFMYVTNVKYIKFMSIHMSLALKQLPCVQLFFPFRNLVDVSYCPYNTVENVICPVLIWSRLKSSLLMAMKLFFWYGVPVTHHSAVKIVFSATPLIYLYVSIIQSPRCCL